jgi:adenine-specific DNA-methyltransferase
MATNEGDVVLDYHLGSGTTAAVAHKMNRKYIGVEQLDYGKNDGVVRLQNVINKDSSGISKAVNWKGGGSFVYCELAKANQDFADKIMTSTAKDELSVVWKQMQETGFLSWKIDPKQIDENADDFNSLSVQDMQKFLLEALDKNMLYVPYSEINNQEFGISEDDKRLNAEFYGKA